MTRGVQNLRIPDPPAAPAALPAQPSSTMRNTQRPPRPKQEPKEYLRWAECGPDPPSHKASTDQVSMQHMGQKHGGQQLLPESVAQLRQLDRAACAVCGTITSQRCNRCGFCNSNTPLRELRVGEYFSGQTTAQTAECSARRCDHRSATSSELAASAPRRTSGRQPACGVSRYGTTWAESFEGAMSSHQGRDRLWPRLNLATTYFGHGLTYFGHCQFLALTRLRRGGR